MDNITAIANAVGYRVILQNHFKENEKYPNKLLGVTLLPVIVISLLEIEMIFKAKLDIETLSYPTGHDGHNIAKLFDLLPKKTQDNISDNYNKQIQSVQRNKGCELLSSNDLVKQLDGNLFTNFRYLDVPDTKFISISLLDSITYFRYVLENLFELPSVERIGNFDYKSLDEKNIETDTEYLKCIWKNI